MKKQFYTVLSCLFIITCNQAKSQNGVGVNTNTPKSYFEDNGSFGKVVTTVTASTTLDATHSSIVANNGAVAITITLPAANTCAGRIYEIKRNASSTANVTISGTIDGVANYLLSYANQSVTVFSDGTNWQSRDGSGDNTNWKLTGNRGTSSSTNFVGTTDNVDLAFRVNNTERMFLRSTGAEVFQNVRVQGVLGSSTEEIRIHNNNSDTYIDYTGGNLNFRDDGGAATLFLEDATGEIGIGTTTPKSLLEINGSFAKKVTLTSNASLALNGTHSIILCNNAGNPITLTLPDPTTCAGRMYDIKKDNLSTADVTIARNGTETIDGLASNYMLRSANTSITILSDGTNWRTINTNNSGGGWALLGNAGTSASTNFIGTTDAVDWVVRTNNTERMRIESAGDVGIGTSAPTSRLHVVASGARTTSYAGTFLSNTATSSTANLDKICLDISSTGTWNGANADNIGLKISAVTGGINNYDAIFNGGGNVGIGLTNPTYLLHVREDLASGKTTPLVLQNRSLTVGAEVALRFSPTDQETVRGSEISGINRTGTNSIDLKFSTTDGSTFSEKMRVTAEGNVGIGVPTPTAFVDIRSDLTGTTGNVKFQLARNAAGDVGMAFNQIGVKSYGIVLRDNTTATGTAGRLAFVDSYFPGGAGTEIMCIGPVPNGFVGIGCNNPQYKLHVIGDIAASGVLRASSATVSTTITACSDIRFKKDVTELQGALANVLKLNGVTYNWKKNEFPGRHFNDRPQIGVIAQELEKVYPELVNTDEDGYKSVDYSKLTPILLEAIKEQQHIIRDLKIENEKLKDSCLEMKSSNLLIENRLKQIESILKIKEQEGVSVRR